MSRKTPRSNRRVYIIILGTVDVFKIVFLKVLEHKKYYILEEEGMIPQTLGQQTHIHCKYTDSGVTSLTETLSSLLREN